MQVEPPQPKVSNYRTLKDLFSVSFLPDLPCTICEALSDGHLTGPSEHHPQLVALQHEVEAALCSQVEGGGGGGDQHVSSPHCRHQAQLIALSFLIKLNKAKSIMRCAGAGRIII